MAQHVDYVADATGFLLQNQPRWRQSASLRLKQDEELRKIKLKMFGPPPPRASSQSRNTNGAKQAADVKNKTTKPNAKDADVVSGWSSAPGDIAGLDSNSIGIEVWSRLTAQKNDNNIPRPHPLIKGLSQQNRCELIKQFDATMDKFLSKYLLDIKASHQNNFQRSLVEPSGRPLLNKRTPVATMCQSSGYNPQLTSDTQKTSTYNPQQRAINRIQKTRPYYNFRELDRTKYRNLKENTTATSSPNPISTSAEENAIDSSEQEENSDVMQKMNSNSDYQNPRNGKCEEEQEDDSDSSALEDSATADESSSSCKNNEQTILNDGGFQVSRPQTMQEFVEKFYMPPSKMVFANRSLPTIKEKNHKLVESILNYRHIVGSREKSEHQKSRYLNLSAPDIRRATVQLLKTSMQRTKTNLSPSPKPEELERTQTSPSSNVAIPNIARINNRQKLVQLTRQSTIVNTSIPDIGVKWKVTRYDT